MKKIIFILFSLSFVSWSVTEKLADFNSISTVGGTFNGKSLHYPIAEKTYQFKAEKNKEITFWTDVDIEYQGQLDLGFVCEYYLGDSLFFKSDYDVFTVSPKYMGVSVVKDGVTNEKYKGKL